VQNVYQQGDRMIDYVYPVVAVERVDSRTWDFRGLRGTCFLIKDGDGLSLTAGHVADELSADRAVGLSETLWGYGSPGQLLLLSDTQATTLLSFAWKV
jgi:hypothetical protein